MMVQSRSILLLVLLLLPCLPTTAAADDSTEEFWFDHGHGEVFSDGVFEVTGTSSVPLNEVAWELVDASTGSVLASGEFLDKVTPSEDGSWSWSQNLTVPQPGCSCRFVVHHGGPDLQSSELVLFLGSGLAWAPVWLSQPMPHLMLTDSDNVTVDLPIVFPPARANGSTVEMERCPASSSGVCKSPSSLISTPLSHVDSVTSATFNPEDWNPEGHWSITSMVVIDGVLSRSAPAAWHLLHDRTAPNASIESVMDANESDRVQVVVNATDTTSGEVSLLELRATSPNGEVRILAASEAGSEFILQPDVAGVWSLQASVQDGAGLTQTAYHNLTVTNLAPQAKVRLNGAVVGNGDALQVKLGQPFLLDASTSKDTASDFLELNHVWWIGEDVRLSGVDQLTNERFQEAGTFDIRLEIVDDDGASDELQFTLEVRNEDAPLGDAVAFGPLLAILLGLFLVGVFLARQRTEGTNIPTWPGEPET